MEIYVLAVLTVCGINFALWGTIGILRFGDERLRRRRRRRGRGAAPPSGDHAAEPTGSRSPTPQGGVRLEDVAVIIPAHDEELVIADTVGAIGELVPLANVHVVSDGSSDATATLARNAGAHVLEVTAGGKAAALKAGIEAFDLADRYRAVLLLDADTRLDAGYFDAALPLFDDPEIVAVAGSASTMWNPRWSAFMASVLSAHRERLYVLFQHLVKYGQTWRFTNVTPIVPGFSSMYRTNILDEIHIDAPGLVIEDFNMTFEVHHRGLGRIGYTPRAVAYTQDPQRLSDYYRQVRRWALGFWQTIRRHRVWVGKFWAALLLTTGEIVTSFLAILLTLGSLSVLLAGRVADELWGGLGPLEGPHDLASTRLGPMTVLLGVVLPDYLLTCATAWFQRRPSYLFYGLFFLPLRFLDAVAGMSSFVRSWGPSSSGRWVSPSRVAIPPPDATERRSV